MSASDQQQQPSGRVADLKTAAAVPLRPREDRKAVMRQPGDSTALKCSMMKAKLAGSTGC